MSELKKHEPITIDVTPDKVEIERPRRPVNQRLMVKRSRSAVAQARDIQRMGQIVQTPNFWLGLIVEMWRSRR
jgi:hypothetical protein